MIIWKLRQFVTISMSKKFTNVFASILYHLKSWLCKILDIKKVCVQVYGVQAHSVEVYSVEVHHSPPLLAFQSEHFILKF